MLIDFSHKLCKTDTVMSEIPHEPPIQAETAEKVVASQATKETTPHRPLAPILDDAVQAQVKIIQIRNEINHALDKVQEHTDQEKMFRFRGKTYRLRKKEKKSS